MSSISAKPKDRLRLRQGALALSDVLVVFLLLTGDFLLACCRWDLPRSVPLGGPPPTSPNSLVSVETSFCLDFDC